MAWKTKPPRTTVLHGCARLQRRAPPPVADAWAAVCVWARMSGGDVGDPAPPNAATGITRASAGRRGGERGGGARHLDNDWARALRASAGPPAPSFNTSADPEWGAAKTLRRVAERAVGRNAAGRQDDPSGAGSQGGGGLVGALRCPLGAGARPDPLPLLGGSRGG